MYAYCTSAIALQHPAAQHACTVHVHMQYLEGGELQCARGEASIELAVLVQHGGQAAPGRPLQDEAERLQYHADEVDDVRVMETVQDGHLRSHLTRGGEHVTPLRSCFTDAPAWFTHSFHEACFPSLPPSLPPPGPFPLPLFSLLLPGPFSPPTTQAPSHPGFHEMCTIISLTTEKNKCWWAQISQPQVQRTSMRCTRLQCSATCMSR